MHAKPKTSSCAKSISIQVMDDGGNFMIGLGFKDQTHHYYLHRFILILYYLLTNHNHLNGCKVCSEVSVVHIPVPWFHKSTTELLNSPHGAPAITILLRICLTHFNDSRNNLMWGNGAHIFQILKHVC